MTRPAPHRARSVEAVILHYDRSPRKSAPRRACSVEAMIMHYDRRERFLRSPPRLGAAHGAVRAGLVTESSAPPSELGGGGTGSSGRDYWNREKR